jgi:DNA (cytosine-5)-methyltransferase 1
VTAAKPIAAVDVFCGVGGMTHGLFQEKIKVVAGIDNDETCKYAYEKNNQAKFLQSDIRTLKPKDVAALYPKGHVRLLVGCAPCQPFSGYTSKKPKGDRWSLLYAFADLIEGVQPDIVSMENVPGLERFRKPPIFDQFCQRLIDAGYHVSYSTVYCPDYGVPQTRSRLVLFGSKFAQVSLVPKTHARDKYVTVEASIKDLPLMGDGEVCPEDPLHRAPKLNEMNKARIQATPEGGGWQDWDSSLVLKCHKKKKGKSYSGVYGRMRWKAPAPTMTTLCTGIGNGRFGHPAQDRAITLREAAIFQTFPRTYKFVDPEVKFSAKAISRQIGNAVPVQLGRIVAKSIKAHLEEHNG